MLKWQYEHRLFAPFSPLLLPVSLHTTLLLHLLAEHKPSLSPTILLHHLQRQHKVQFEECQSTCYFEPSEVKQTLLHASITHGVAYERPSDKRSDLPEAVGFHILYKDMAAVLALEQTGFVELLKKQNTESANAIAQSQLLHRRGRTQNVHRCQSQSGYTRCKRGVMLSKRCKSQSGQESKVLVIVVIIHWCGQCLFNWYKFEIIWGEKKLW